MSDWDRALRELIRTATPEDLWVMQVASRLTTHRTPARPATTGPAASGGGGPEAKGTEGRTTMKTLGEWLDDRIWDDCGRAPQQIQDIIDAIEELPEDHNQLQRLVRRELLAKYGPKWEGLPLGDAQIDR